MFGKAKDVDLKKFKYSLNVYLRNDHNTRIEYTSENKLNPFRGGDIKHFLTWYHSRPQSEVFVFYYGLDRINCKSVLRSEILSYEIKEERT